MEYFDLSSAQFADKIGIQRSALSHVLSGRNRPSLDFVLKIKSTFPEISLDWITLGSGNMLVSSGGLPVSAEVLEGNDTGRSRDDEKIDLFSTRQQELKQEKTGPVNAGVQDKSILKEIVLFYADGTFERFIPRK